MVNVVDVFMVLFMGAMVYFKRSDGIVAELFKLIGVFSAVFITLHYYVRFASILRSNLFAKEIVTEIFAYCILAVAVLSVFAMIIRGWETILRIKSFEALDRWGNFILSLVRGYLICGLIYIGLLLTGSGYLEPQARQSLTRHVFRPAAIEFYRFTYRSFVEKIVPGEGINKKVFKLVEGKPFDQEI